MKTQPENNTPSEITHPATVTALATTTKTLSRAAQAKLDKQAAQQAKATVVTMPVPATERALAATSPKDMLYLAEDLANFVKENKLASDIQGKQFVNVEGWQYAGSRLGYTPIIEHVINVSPSEAEIKYQAKATIFDLRTQQTVGAGFAICSNKESGKKFYQEFAIASTAQTRAIGKAYRNILAWVMRAAGYEPTPTEEMEYLGNTPAGSTSGTTPVMTASTNPTASAAPAPAAAEAEPVQYATQKQKEEIIILLNHPKIGRQEKTKMLLNINRFDEERALAAIAKLRRAIVARQLEAKEITPEEAADALARWGLAAA
jgi:hypothetical protein